MPEAGRDIVLAGAIVSIALNPIMLYGAQDFTTVVSSRKNQRGMFNLREDDLAHLRADERRALKELVILVGVGRVGTIIAENVHKTADVDLVAIEVNPETVAALRAKGFHAILRRRDAKGSACRRRRSKERWPSSYGARSLPRPQHRRNGAEVQALHPRHRQGAQR